MIDIYKWLWSKVGKRPWTYIYRDLWHQFEILMQTQWFLTGVIVFYYWGMKGTVIFWVTYFYGFINGHFFWGTKYVAGQKGK